ncbi:hypothetical protein C6361_00320 [Plantactinospora sp. BC1]|uniref:DUF742 domain-containing protein n=1 Tax=Plantactinospora sp. BC1 TaxID=2108470 RepID=UPI000D163FC0|nr:DUF742 domain-containing protein [Plantactinospora sp. BC1]AVT28198.1 hypothetical protein C6361_00320 [Plantactinospora sp. BC1]
MAESRAGGDYETEESGLVPLYVLVRGRTRPRNSDLDLATQVIAVPVNTRLDPELQDIINQCTDWMSVAEIGAHLHRPLTIVKVMVDVLVEQRLLRIGSPAQQKVTDMRLLEAVLAGLERL